MTQSERSILSDKTYSGKKVLKRFDHLDLKYPWLVSYFMK